jgi:ubiquinone/menaquinone biosynthesis C-methylase UbiE
MGLNNWRTEVAKHHKLPLPDAAVDIAIAGWSVCYGVTWHPDNWQFHIEAALAEMKRILRPRGVIILLETLGTGYETPTPPPALLPYFALLEATGFQSRTIRTDYRFQSLQEAEEITRFFFGAELAAQVMRDNLIILPECTGIWWLQMV